jgi:TolB-like protein/Flp pilus assembly protein TadD
VHEAVMGRLAGIPGLRVAPRTAVDRYRDANVPPSEIARRIGADVLIEGTVLYDEQRVHVTAQLVEAASNTKVWEQAFDRALTVENLFDIQAEIADRVTKGLARSLSVGERRYVAALPTASVPAYEAFLLGKYHYRRRQPGDIQVAIEQFEIAVNTDGAFADAWDWLAFAWIEAAGEIGWTTPVRAFPHARAAALRALELDPSLATSQALLGFLRAVYDWDWQQGLAEIERAVAAAPHETGTVWSNAYVLSLLGRHDEAIALVSDLAAAFPEDGRMKREVAERLIDAGRYAEATRAANAAGDAGAEPAQVHQVLGIAAVGAGQLDTAIAEFESALVLQQRAPQAAGYLAATYALAGRNDEARALLSEIEANADAEQLDVMLARVYAAFGDRGRALALLESSAELRLRDVCGIGNDPFFVTLRGEARFAAVVARIGLVPAHPAGW